MIRALLVIDVHFYRECLAAFLAQRADMQVVAALSGADDISEAVERESPEVILLDTSIPNIRATLAKLRTMERPPRIVALAIGESPASVAECAGAGVLGYVSRSASVAELLQCLRYVSRAEPYCSPGVLATLLHGIAALGEHTQLASRCGCMTTRELEILKLVGCGLSNKVIASRLNISHATAKNHVHHILEKLQLRSRTQVAAYFHGRRAVESGIMPASIEAQ